MIESVLLILRKYNYSMKFCIIQLVYQFNKVKHMIYVSDLMPKLNTVCIVYNTTYIVQILALYIEPLLQQHTPSEEKF